MSVKPIVRNSGTYYGVDPDEEIMLGKTASRFRFRFWDSAAKQMLFAELGAINLSFCVSPNSPEEIHEIAQALRKASK